MSATKGAGAANIVLAGAIAAFALAAAALYGLQARSGDRIEARTRAASAVSASARLVLDIPLAVLGILEFDDNVEAGRQAPVLFLDAAREARNALDAAGRAAPDEAAEIESFRRRLDDLIDQARAPLAIGNATSGLTRAAELSPSDLAQLASGAKLAAEPSVGLQALSRDLAAFGDKLTTDALEVTGALRRRFDAAVLALAAAGIAAVLAARAAGRHSLAFELRNRGEARRRLGDLGAVQTRPPQGSPEDMAATARAISASQSLAFLADPTPLARPSSLRDPQAWSRGTARPPEG